MTRKVGNLVVIALFLFGSVRLERAGEVPMEYRQTFEKGLEWLAKTQHKDGHWEATGGRYPVSMTALAGMAMLMEGSTIRQGKYAKNIELATTWLMDQAKPSGLIAGTSNRRTGTYQRYMYGHGFSTMFLSCIYGEEEDAKRRRELKELLIKAVEFCASAQSTRGGWYYMSAKESNNADEGSVTITQVQALRAARNAGIPVPKKIIEKAQKYLKDCTGPNGGVYYSIRSRMEKPAITAAGVACLFNAGEYKSNLAKRWLKYCRQRIPISGNNGRLRFGHFEYTHYYYSQCVYILGDDGWERLFGETPQTQQVTWTKYRDAIFPRLKSMQQSNGSWSGSMGSVYVTSLYLTILQLPKETLPIYMR